MTELQPLEDAIAYVRKHQQLFFLAGNATPLACALDLLGDAVSLGANNTAILRRDSWWIVSADIAWLSHDKHSLRYLFTHLVPFPEAGDNSTRSEVLVSAFAKDVAVEMEGIIQQVIGQDHPFDRDDVNATNWECIVAFRFAAE